MRNKVFKIQLKSWKFQMMGEKRIIEVVECKGTY